MSLTQLFRRNVRVCLPCMTPYLFIRKCTLSLYIEPGKLEARIIPPFSCWPGFEVKTGSLFFLYTAVCVCNTCLLSHIAIRQDLICLREQVENSQPLPLPPS